MLNSLASPVRNLLYGTLFMVVVSACATAAYMAHGWSFADAIYMVLLTVYTVGYGEVRPIDSPALREVTIALMVFGCTGMIFLTGTIVQLFTFSQFQILFGANRMQKDIDKLKDHVIICGYGRIGLSLSEELRAGAVPFVVIERGDARLAELKDGGMLTIQGDATDEETLKRAGIARARALATVLPNDAANVFITLSARSLNKDLVIIARGEAPSTERKLTQAGADRDRAADPHRGRAHGRADRCFARRPTCAPARRPGSCCATSAGSASISRSCRPPRAGAHADGATVAALEQQACGAFMIVALEREGVTLMQPARDAVVYRPATAWPSSGGKDGPCWCGSCSRLSRSRRTARRRTSLDVGYFPT